MRPHPTYIYYEPQRSPATGDLFFIICGGAILLFFHGPRVTVSRCMQADDRLVSGSKYHGHSGPLLYDLHHQADNGRAARTPDPDSVLKSAGCATAASLSSCFKVILTARLLWVTLEGDDADGSTDGSLCPMGSIQLRLSMGSLSNPTDYSMSSKEIPIQLPSA